MTSRFLAVGTSVALRVRACKHDTVVIAAVNETRLNLSFLMESHLFATNTWKLNAFLFK